jgi:flagellin-like protein
MGTRKRSRKNKGSRAVSPVIATVILVAIAITIAIAVAYWMGGIAGQYTRFEQIEIQNAIVQSDGASPPQWNVTLTMKNTGTRDTTLISMFINDVEVDAYGAGGPAALQWTTNMTNTEVITSGDSLAVVVWLANPKTGSTISSGTTVNIKLHSAGGMDFPKLIELI